MYMHIILAFPHVNCTGEQKLVTALGTFLCFSLSVRLQLPYDSDLTTPYYGNHCEQ